MLNKVWLAAVAVLGLGRACDLTIDTYAVPGCSVLLNSKTVDGSDEGKCNYAPNIDSYLIWSCGDKSVNVQYFKDSSCSQSDGGNSISEGQCVVDSKTGFYARASGSCCGLSSEPMPGQDGAGTAPMPGQAGAGTQPRLGQDGHGTAPDMDTYQKVTQTRLKLNEMLQARKALLLGGDSADEKHYRKVERRENMHSMVQTAAQKGTAALNKAGQTFRSNRSGMKGNLLKNMKMPTIRGRKPMDGSFFAHNMPPLMPRNKQQQPPPPPPQENGQQQQQQPPPPQQQNGGQQQPPPPQQRSDGHYQA